VYGLKRTAKTGLTALAGSLLAMAAVAPAAWAAADAVGVTTAMSSTAIPIYATEAVTKAAGVVTDNVAVVFTDTGFISNEAITFNLALTLPTGVTFTNSVAPTATPSGAFTAAVQNGSASNVVNFLVTAPSTGGVAATGKVTFSGFNLTGATALQSKVTASATGLATGFSITGSISGSAFPAAIANAALSTPSTGLANSTSALALASVAPVGALTALAIDIGTSGLGQKFIQGGGTPSATTDSLLADVGASAITLNGTVAADGATPFAFAGASATVVLSGNFTNIVNAYLAPAGTTACATTAPSTAVTGTVTSSTITFAGVTMPTSGNTVTSELCITANGTGVIGSNPTGLGLSASIGGSTSTIAAGAGTNALDTYTFNGIAQSMLYSGNFGLAYPAFIRVVNGTGASGTVLALVQTETGGTGVGTVATVAANNNTLVSVGNVITNSGVTLDSTGRASLTILAPKGFQASQLLVNPGGIVVELGTGTSP
jgi:hypothetical protein